MLQTYLPPHPLLYYIHVHATKSEYFVRPGNIHGHESPTAKTITNVVNSLRQRERRIILHVVTRNTTRFKGGFDVRMKWRTAKKRTKIKAETKKEKIKDEGNRAYRDKMQKTGEDYGKRYEKGNVKAQRTFVEKVRKVFTLCRGVAYGLHLPQYKGNHQFDQICPANASRSRPKWHVIIGLARTQWHHVYDTSELTLNQNFVKKSVTQLQWVQLVAKGKISMGFIKTQHDRLFQSP